MPSSISDTVRTNFDSRRLQIFLVITEEGSFTAAAKRLAMSQPAVSQQLKALEEAIGSPLFVREPRGVRLTPAGEELIGHARRVESALADAYGKVSRFGPQQSLRVAASTTVANHLLPYWVSDFMEEHGRGPLELLVGNTRSMIEAVESGRVSLAIVEGLASSVRLDTVSIEGDRLIPVCEVTRTFTFKAARRGETPIIWREQGSGTRDVVEEALRRHANRPPRPTDMVCGSGESLHAAILAGLGVGFVSDLICRDSLDAGRLRRLDDVDFQIDRPFTCVIASHGLSGREREFFDWCR